MSMPSGDRCLCTYADDVCPYRDANGRRICDPESPRDELAVAAHTSGAETPPTYNPTGFVIREVWAFVAVDPNDGDEGIIGTRLGDSWLPFVAADRTRLELLRPRAEAIAKAAGLPVVLIRLHERTVVEVIEP